MKDGFDDGGVDGNGAGELFSGEGAAVLPEEAGDVEAVGRGKFGDGPMEEGLALLVGLGAQFLVAPLLEEGAGALLIDPGEIFLLDKQEGDETARGAEETKDRVDIDITAGEDHPVGIDLPVIGKVDAGVEQGPFLPQGHIPDATGGDGVVSGMEKEAAHTPGIVFGKIGETGIHGVPECIDDLAHHFDVVGKRVRLDKNAFFQQFGPMGLYEIAGQQPRDFRPEQFNILRPSAADKMEMGIHHDITVHADMVLEGQYGNQVSGKHEVFGPFKQHGHPCPV